MYKKKTSLVSKALSALFVTGCVLGTVLLSAAFHDLHDSDVPTLDEMKREHGDAWLAKRESCMEEAAILTKKLMVTCTLVADKAVMQMTPQSAVR